MVLAIPGGYACVESFLRKGRLNGKIEEEKLDY
jgi:hypothetical protein